MFVEKLSLFGFKSFNQKVALDFGPGISGVIGPNGCGKSNIVDAIRWVLGEQSTKQLRGAKMEDVIFNGTRSEKPLSIAEVELTLNNASRKLPIEYTTVTVGRRLYRSGLSEYVINKKPVRLRDVRELFFDTGMGSHAYSVIERQMVDNILSDTTGHRRFLFEEAAGIMKYKTRKKEALTKLEATDRDLLRLQDIISEVERQVTTLRRQVGKARRHRELTGEIRQLDLALSQRQRAAWLASLLAHETSHRDDLESAETAETEAATIEAVLQALHVAVLEEERKLSEARERLALVDDEIGQRNSRVLVLRERQMATRNRIRESQEHRVRLADRLERNEASAVDVSARLSTLETREAQERIRLDEAEKGLEAVDARVRDLRGQLHERKDITSRLREERIRGEGTVQSLGDRSEDLGRRERGIDERLLATREEARGFEDALEVSRANVAASARRFQEIEEERLQIDMRRENLAERLELHRRDLEERRRERAGLESRQKTLEDLRSGYVGFDPGVRALMLEGARDPGVVGTIADLIRVPAEWVPALEPALSAVWQCVVVTDTAVARRLLERLREESLGYATLIPLDRVGLVAGVVADTGGATDRDEKMAGAPEPGILWASEVVEAADEHRPLLRRLLGDLALADDMTSALGLLEDGRARRAATRQGDLLDAVRLAGGKGGPSGSELVEREEGIERCQKEIARIVARLSDLSGHEEALRDEGETLDANLASKLEDLDRARSAKQALEKEEAGLMLQLRHARSAAESLAEEARILSEDRAGCESEREMQSALLADVSRRSDHADVLLRELEEVAREEEEKRETVVRGVHEMRLLWARLESDREEAHASRARLAAESSDLVSERERTERDETEAKEQVEVMERELEELGARVEALHATRAERLAVVGERERERSEAAAKEHQDADTLREARRRASQARQALHSVELKAQELRSDIRHLEERLRQDYDILPAELDRVETLGIPDEAAETLADLRERLKRIGPVNLLAVEEYEEKSRRFEFMTTQRDDLLRAKESLQKTITEINKTASKIFLETFTQVQENFQKTFKVLFQGGECSLTLSDEDPLEADIEVTARPRGKKPQTIHQLSSGERALTAIALLFAIYLVKPSPFCILDEVDAPLDDANIDRFVNMVKEFSKRTQFIVITHNKKTMEAADCLYGVTMQRPGVSSVVSVKLEGERAAPREETREGNGHGNGNGSGHADEEAVDPESMIAQ